MPMRLALPYLAPLFLAPLFMALVATTAPAAAEGGVNLGILECKVAGGFGYVLGSSRDMTCTFKRSDGGRESYSGAFDRYGLDLGYTDERWMYWGVFAPGDVGKGALAGTYGGAGADVAAGLGLGANALFGGSGDQIALQPVSVNGNVGVGVAAGVARVTLRAGR